MKNLFIMVVSLLLVSCFSPTAKLERERDSLKSKLVKYEENQKSFERELILFDRSMRDLMLEAKESGRQLDMKSFNNLASLISGGFGGQYDANAAMEFAGSDLERENVHASLMNRAQDLEEDRNAVNKELQKVQIEVKKTQILLRQVEKKIKLAQKR